MTILNLKYLAVEYLYRQQYLLLKRMKQNRLLAKIFNTHDKCTFTFESVMSSCVCKYFQKRYIVTILTRQYDFVSESQFCLTLV